MTPGRSLLTILVTLSAAPIASCGEDSKRSDGTPPKPEVREYVFIPNNSSDFWKIAEAGVKAAEKELRQKDAAVVCTVKMPNPASSPEQQRILDNLLARPQVKGIAISPLTPEESGMIEQLNRVADRVVLICHDSDAPASHRRAYIGTLNYKAGREVGRLMKQAMPEGGKAMLFVGKPDVQNAVDRQRGVIDELAGSNLAVVDTRFDFGDTAKAKANVETTLTSNREVKLMVGLWAYNGPAIAEAVAEATEKGLVKRGEIKIVCFDELAATLEAIRNGVICATVVQKPFEFGYRSMNLLYELDHGNTANLPADGLIDTGVRTIDKENVAEFCEELKKLTGQ